MRLGVGDEGVFVGVLIDALKGVLVGVLAPFGGPGVAVAVVLLQVPCLRCRNDEPDEERLGGAGPQGNGVSVVSAPFVGVMGYGCCASRLHGSRCEVAVSQSTAAQLA